MALLNDRLTRGFWAGFIAYIPVAIFNIIVYDLKISKLRYSDFSAVFVYGHKPTSASETLFAFFVTLAFTSILGIIFAYFISYTSSRNIIFKGAIFSSGAWFCFYAVTILFKIPELMRVDLISSLCNLSGSIIWGIISGYFLWWLDTKGKQKREA